MILPSLWWPEILMIICNKHHWVLVIIWIDKTSFSHFSDFAATIPRPFGVRYDPYTQVRKQIYLFQQILFYQNMLQSIQLLDSKRQIQVLNQKSDQNKKHKNISKFAEYLFINFDSFLWTCSCVLIVQKLLTNINHEMRTLCDAFTKFWKSHSFDHFSWNVNQNQ